MNINWYPGHMAKAKRLISENLKVIDLVFELIDARIPFASKIKDIDKLLNNTPRILVFNKWDLCDQKVTKEWIKYYEDMGYKVVVTDLLHKTHVDVLMKAVNVIKAEINARRRLKGMKPRSIRALVVGIPNAGKSTLINTLVKQKVVAAANKPGVTRGLSWVRISDDIELLDTPGILWPKFEDEIVAFNLASFTAIKEDVLPMAELAFYILRTMAKYYPQILKERYGIDELEEDIEITLEKIGRGRNALLKGNVVEHEQVYRIIINDLKNGHLGKVTFDRMGGQDE